MRNLYHILHLTPQCSAMDIKRAYRQLAHKYHPDRNPSPEAAELFRQIMDAYATLSNVAMRTKYDILLRNAAAPTPMPTAEHKTEAFYKKYGTANKFKTTNYAPPTVPPPVSKPDTWADKIGLAFIIIVGIYGVATSLFIMNEATGKIEFDLALDRLVGAILFLGAFFYSYYYLTSLPNKK